MGNGGYFRWRNMLKFSVTSAARDNGSSSGQVKGLCGRVDDAVLNLLEQAPAKRSGGCLVQGVADGLRHPMATACAYEELVHPVGNDRALTGYDVDDSLDNGPLQG